MYEALKKAAAFNAGAILDFLDDGAVPTRSEIGKVCAAVGYADEISVDLAIKQLLSDGFIAKRTVNGLTYFSREQA